MDTNKNEEAEVEESLDLPEIAEDQEDTTDWKAEAVKLREKAIAQRERTKSLKKAKAETDAKLVDLIKGQTLPPPKTGELDETQLDYLDLKGISEQEEIDVIQRVVQRTGQTVRQALKDDYVISKLAELKKQKEVKAATPSSTRRSAGSSDSLELAIAKYEQSGFDPSTLPDDFDLRSKVIDSQAAKFDKSTPSWRK